MREKNSMKSKRLWRYFLSSIIVLIPLFVGVLSWNDLPEELPVHFNFSGEAYGTQSKAFAVFFIPLFIIFFHFMVIMAVKPGKNENTNKQEIQFSEKMVNVLLSICPIVSLMCGLFVYGSALNITLDIITIFCLVIGVIYIFLGNNLTKMRRNKFIGLKLPWLFSGVDKSENNWEKTNRIAGYLLCLFGCLFMINAFIKLGGSVGLVVLLVASIVVPILIPTIVAISRVN